MSFKALYWIGGVAIFAGAGLYIHEQYKWSQKIKTQFKNYKILRLGLTNTIVGIDMVLTNEGMLSADIYKINARVLANGIFVARVNMAHPVALAAQSEVTVPLRIALNPTKVFKSLGQIASVSRSLDNTEFEFKGWITANKFGIPIPVPLNTKVTVAQMKT